MNRYLVLIYLLGVPIVALTTLYELGSAHLWSGFSLCLDKLPANLEPRPRLRSVRLLFRLVRPLPGYAILHRLGIRATRLLGIARRL